jgi:hypothetical protein
VLAWFKSDIPILKRQNWRSVSKKNFKIEEEENTALLLHLLRF